MRKWAPMLVHSRASRWWNDRQQYFERTSFEALTVSLYIDRVFNLIKTIFLVLLIDILFIQHFNYYQMRDHTIQPSHKPIEEIQLSLHFALSHTFQINIYKSYKAQNLMRTMNEERKAWLENFESTWLL